MNGGQLNENGLTPKQQAFVDNYLVSFNATDAARRAGYSKKTAQQISAENLLKPVIQAALVNRYKQIAAKSEKQIINVHEEFCEQLEFAKQLRLEAKEILAHPTEPGRLDLRLSAHEVDLTYYDHGELNEWGKPRKKTDTMQFLVDEITSKSQAEPVKITLKHLDMRKFALECLDRADMCIDKFARMGGDYAKEKTNPTDIKALAEEIAASLIREGHPADQVQAEVSKLFPQLVSEAVN